MTDLLSRRAASRNEARKPGTAAPVAASAPARPNTNKLAAIREDARKRTAAAWTCAKNLLPTSPVATQHRLASALIGAPTGILTETLRSVARMAFYTKAAEKFEAETKTELNVFVESEPLLNKLRSEVLTELKADDPLKVATNKKAEELPAVADEKKPAPEAPLPAEPAPASDMPAPGGNGGTENAGEFKEPAPAGDAAPGAMGEPGAGVDPASPANAANDVSGEEGSLLGQIQGVETEITNIEQEVEQADEEFDLSKIFDPELQADKAQNLANQGDNMEEMDHDDFFSPSQMGDMMDKADMGGKHETTTPEDFFKEGSGPDPMSVFFGKSAAEDVDVPMGDMASHFETDLAGDKRDSATDHDDLLSDVLDSLSQPDMVQKRDTEPNLETPVAPDKFPVPTDKNAKKSSIRTVGNPTPAKAATAASSDDAIASLIFRD